MPRSGERNSFQFGAGEALYGLPEAGAGSLYRWCPFRLPCGSAGGLTARTLVRGERRRSWCCKSHDRSPEGPAQEVKMAHGAIMWALTMMKPFHDDDLELRLIAPKNL